MKIINQAINNLVRKSQGYSLEVVDDLSYGYLQVNNKPIYARIANTRPLLEKGLMGVESLEKNEGCLLVFAENLHQTLWMKNCMIDMQVAFIDKQGTILEIQDMQYKNPNVIHRSSSPCKYALEMNTDFFTTNNIKVGTKISFIEKY